MVIPKYEIFIRFGESIDIREVNLSFNETEIQIIKEELKMKEKIDVTIGRGLFKSAVVIGAGLVIGNHLGSLLSGALQGVEQGIIKNLADKGNETAQEFCNKYNLKYERKSEKDSSEKVM